MLTDQDPNIPDLTEWLVSEDDETVEELALDELRDAVLVEDDVIIDVAL